MAIVGNEVDALEVGDIDEALAFYGRLFDFELRGKSKTSAFIDLGDQFRSRRAAPRPPTTAVILDSWSMTRTPSATRWRRRAWTHCPVRFLISSTRGVTV